jgi:hypothetical protein
MLPRAAATYPTAAILQAHAAQVVTDEAFTTACLLDLAQDFAHEINA